VKLRAFILQTVVSWCGVGVAFASEAAGHAPAAHGEAAAHAEEGASMHLPNVVNILHHFFPDQPLVRFLHEWENVFFALAVAAFLAWTFSMAARRASLIPAGLQNVYELAAESLDNFVTGILGARWRKFTPFIGSLFIYIFIMNFAGVIPFLKSPTSSFGITFPLGLSVFLYVQATGIRELGFFKYLDHLAGEPRNAVGFILIPLMLFLHVVGELVKPLSLSLRLFGNIWGEDVLIAVFVSMGSKMPLPIPIHFPFLFLALLTSFVQATVFCLLTTIYIALMLPHEHGEEGHEPVHP
jgi:F-type H+-transporting ATPase subunit a